MKLINKYLILVSVLILGVLPQIKAQDDLEISKVFSNYGKQKGSTMVEMTREMLKEYDFSYYKSIVINNNKDAGDFTRQCLKIDQENSKKVKQVVTGGVVVSIYLQLPKKGKYHRLILFNETTKPERQMTLIYIESEKDSEEILNLILKKK